MKWNCWLFPWLVDSPDVAELVGDCVATKRLKVGSSEFREAVGIISKEGGGGIRLNPVFSIEELLNFSCLRVVPKKIWTVSDRMFELNLDHIESLQPIKTDKYGVYKERNVFYSNKPKLQENQFALLDFSNHIVAPVNFRLDGIEAFPLQNGKSEIWGSHYVLSTSQFMSDFIVDDSVELVTSNTGFDSPRFKGLLSLNESEFEVLKPIFRLPGPSDVGDSDWGCTTDFFESYLQSQSKGLSFEPILQYGTDQYQEYISEWLEILDNLNTLGTWRSQV